MSKKDREGTAANCEKEFTAKCAGCPEFDYCLGYSHGFADQQASLGAAIKEIGVWSRKAGLQQAEIERLEAYEKRQREKLKEEIQKSKAQIIDDQQQITDLMGMDSQAAKVLEIAIEIMGSCSRCWPIYKREVEPIEQAASVQPKSEEKEQENKK